jgi:hypothetical protein
MKLAHRRNIRPKGFENEKILVDNIVSSCRKRRTAMITGNYVVKEGANTVSGDRRLLGNSMLSTVELCAKVIEECTKEGVQQPVLLIIPNDIVSGTFSSSDERRRYKAEYLLPREITAILRGYGISSKPTYFFTRDFSKSAARIKQEHDRTRREITNGNAEVVVMFESFAQNMASKELRKVGKSSVDKGYERIRIALTAKDSFSGKGEERDTAVVIRNPNGSPFCSFIAANIFNEFEKLGFEQMVNTFVIDEHPCVDKAAGAYHSHFKGMMPIRNVYMDNNDVLVDNSIQPTV